ncbi:MAG: outer membrane lipoprotein-sorting protein [Panacagrimonas sp.]
MNRPALIAASLLAALVINAAQAETPEEKGLAIAREADQRTDGFQDYTSSLTMTLKAKNGQEAIRELRFKTLEAPGDGDKSLTLFDQPKDVEGTTLLTYAHKTADDDIWLFLPALKRVKRIAGNNKSGPFMGSEFAFEDFGTQEVEKYTYKYLREETLDGEECFVIERVPTEKTSGYSRQEAWLDKAEYRLQKIDYFSKNGEFLKTLRASEYQKYLDKFWYPNRFHMVNHDTGRSTLLQFKDYKFRNGYTERDFDQSALEAAR